MQSLYMRSHNEVYILCTAGQRSFSWSTSRLFYIFFLDTYFQQVARNTVLVISTYFSSVTEDSSQMWAHYSGNWIWFDWFEPSSRFHGYKIGKLSDDLQMFKSYPVGTDNHISHHFQWALWRLASQKDQPPPIPLRRYLLLWRDNILDSPTPHGIAQGANWVSPSQEKIC